MGTLTFYRASKPYWRTQPWLHIRRFSDGWLLKVGRLLIVRERKTTHNEY